LGFEKAIFTDIFSQIYKINQDKSNHNNFNFLFNAAIYFKIPVFKSQFSIFKFSVFSTKIFIKSNLISNYIKTFVDQNDQKKLLILKLIALKVKKILCNFLSLGNYQKILRFFWVRKFRFGRIFGERLARL